MARIFSLNWSCNYVYMLAVGLVGRLGEKVSRVKIKIPMMLR